MSEGLISVAESGNVDEALDMEKAKQVGEALFNAYPGYLWSVSFQGGAIVVKLGQIQASDTISRRDKGHGFLLPEHYSASHLAHMAVMAGGEILERAGLRRGSWRGDIPTALDVS